MSRVSSESAGRAVIKERTRRFWDVHPCGGRWQSVREKMAWRYEKEPWIPEIVRKAEVNGKRVLEVGCGPGLDLALFRLHGATAVGVDLSFGSLKEAQRGFEELGIRKAALLIQADAEHLPFEPETFDLVYSNGVLHITPDMERGIEQIYAVLRKGGQAIVMVYRRWSPLQVVMDGVRMILRAFSILGGQTEVLYEGLKRLFNPNRRNPEHGTVLEELLLCPLIKTYRVMDLWRLFHAYSRFETTAFHNGLAYLGDFFPRGQGWLGRMRDLFLKLDRTAERWLGFYIFVFARK